MTGGEIQLKGNAQNYLGSSFPGNKIGMTTVAVLTGPLGKSELEKKADIVLNSISEIPSLLQKL